MNDFSTPQPRDSAEPTATVSDRPLPLDGRVLLHAGTSHMWQVRDHVDAVRSGLVLCGKGAYEQAARLHQRGFAAPLLIDPGVYAVHAATEDAPFPAAEVTDSAADMLTFDDPQFDDPLLSSLYRQRCAGVAAAMTPTGYIHAEDSDALLAAVRRTVRLDNPSVILTMPVDVSWLREDNVGQLIAALKLFRGTKALMLGGQMDPLGHFPQAVDNLRRVLAEVPRCALLRTDLAVFGALAHGASFGSFGVTGSMRHIVPPGEPVEKSRIPVRSPQVLFPELLGFFLGTTIAHRFAAADRPRCDCSVCNGDGLDRFTTMEGELQRQAAGHNIEIMGRWLDALMAETNGYERQQKWHELCHTAKEHHSALNARLGLKKGFTVGKQLNRWASLVPSPTTVDGAKTTQKTR